MKGATPRKPRVRPAETEQHLRPRRAFPGAANIRGYLLAHAQALISSLGRLCRNPVSNLMTTAVIAIALALPATMLVVLNNLQQVTGGWEGNASISLYMKPAVGDLHLLAKRLSGWPEIAAVRTLTPAQALEEFRTLSGFSAELDTLEENPLPGVVVLTPTAEFMHAAAMEDLIERLRQLPEVDLAQLDLQWVQRLTALMDLGRRAVLAIGVLLALGVLLIVGNTIRLEIQNRREEIEVTKLIGATDGFIRRPFLYTGCWHGFAGALIAWILVELGFWQLQGPVQRLAGLYSSNFGLQTLDAQAIGILIGGGMLLGLMGSWLAVSRHLGAIEPA